MNFKTPNQKNYPSDMKQPDYPKSAKSPTVPENDTPKNTLNDDNNPTAASELPTGQQMPVSVQDRHQRGADGVGDPHRDQNPVETAPYLAPKPGFVRSDLTQKKVMEQNDPTHNQTHQREWEDKNFDNRRLFY